MNNYPSLFFLFLSCLLHSYCANHDEFLIDATNEDLRTLLTKFNYAVVYLYNNISSTSTSTSTSPSPLSRLKEASSELTILTPAVGLMTFNCQKNPNELCREVSTRNGAEFDIYGALIFIYDNSYEVISQKDSAMDIGLYVRDMLNITQVKKGFNRTMLSSDMSKLFFLFDNSSYEEEFDYFFHENVPFCIKSLFEFIIVNDRDLDIIVHTIGNDSVPMKQLGTGNGNYNITVLFFQNITIPTTMLFSVEEKITDVTLSQILYNVFPSLIPYDPNDKFFKAIATTTIGNHFLLLLNTQIQNTTGSHLLENFQSIANDFKINGYYAWFTYKDLSGSDSKNSSQEMNSSSGNENENENEIDPNESPVCFFYKEFLNSSNEKDVFSDIDNYFFLEDEINSHHLIHFFQNFHSLKSPSMNSEDRLGEKRLGIYFIEDVRLLELEQVFIIRFTDESSTDPSLGHLSKKWIFLLERYNYLVNYPKSQIPVYTMRTKAMESFFGIPRSENSIWIFRKNINREDDDGSKKKIKKKLNFSKYEKGPSLQYFQNFVNQHLNRKISIEPKEIEEYFREIFYNSEYMELEDDSEEERKETFEGEDSLKSSDESALKEDL